MQAELYNCYSYPTSSGTTGMGMSHSSSTSSMPICRICQLPSIEPHNTLISPCRCLGSIRYVHNPCLAVRTRNKLIISISFPPYFLFWLGPPGRSISFVYARSFSRNGYTCMKIQVFTFSIRKILTIQKYTK